MRTFVVARDTRKAVEIPELYRDLQEAREIVLRWSQEGIGVAVSVLYLDYLGEPDPPWGEKEVVQALVQGVVRYPYQGKRERHPALQALYRHFAKRGYAVWYVPFELWTDRPLVLWTPTGAHPLEV